MHADVEIMAGAVSQRNQLTILLYFAFVTTVRTTVATSRADTSTLYAKKSQEGQREMLTSENLLNHWIL